MIAALVVLALLCAGCANGDAAIGLPPVVAPPTGPVSLERDVQPIFTANCALAGCHGGSSPQLGLDLSAGHAYASTVNVPSAEIPSLQRVDPGQSDLSYLILKVEGDPSIIGVRMPADGTPLPGPTVRIIRDWIDQGAPDN